MDSLDELRRQVAGDDEHAQWLADKLAPILDEQELPRPDPDQPGTAGAIGQVLSTVDWWADGRGLHNRWRTALGMPPASPDDFERVRRRAADWAVRWASRYVSDLSVLSSPRNFWTLASWYAAADAAVRHPSPIQLEPGDYDAAARNALGEVMARHIPALALPAEAGRQTVFALLAGAYDSDPTARAIHERLLQLDQRPSAQTQLLGLEPPEDIARRLAPPGKLVLRELSRVYADQVEGVARLRRLQSRGLARAELQPVPELVRALAAADYDPVVLAPAHPALEELGTAMGSAAPQVWDQLRQLPPMDRAGVAAQIGAQLTALSGEEAYRKGTRPVGLFFEALTIPLVPFLSAARGLAEKIPGLERAERASDRLAEGALAWLGYWRDLADVRLFDDLPLDDSDREALREARLNWHAVGELMRERIGARELTGAAGAVMDVLQGLVFEPAMAILEADADSVVMAGMLAGPTLARRLAPVARRIPPIRNVLAARLAAPLASQAFDEMMAWARKLPETERGALLRRTYAAVAQVADTDHARAAVIRTALERAQEAADPLTSTSRILYRTARDRFYATLDPAGFVAERIGQLEKTPPPTTEAQIATLDRLLAGEKIDPELFRTLEIPGDVEPFQWLEESHDVLTRRHEIGQTALRRLLAQRELIRADLSRPLPPLESVKLRLADVEREIRSVREGGRAQAAELRTLEQRRANLTATIDRLRQSAQTLEEAGGDVAKLRANLREVITTRRQVLAEMRRLREGGAERRALLDELQTRSERLRTTAARLKETRWTVRKWQAQLADDLKRVDNRIAHVNTFVRETELAMESPRRIARGLEMDPTVVDYLEPADITLAGFDPLEPEAVVKELSVAPAPAAYQKWLAMRQSLFADIGPAVDVGTAPGLFARLRRAKAIGEKIREGFHYARAMEQRIGRALDRALIGSRAREFREAFQELFRRPGWDLDRAAAEIAEKFPEVRREVFLDAVREVTDLARHCGQRLYEMGFWDAGELRRHLQDWSPVVYERIPPPGAAVMPPFGETVRSELLREQRQVVGFGPHGHEPWRLVWEEAGQFQEKFFPTRREAATWADRELGPLWERRGRIVAPIPREMAEAQGLVTDLFRARLQRLGQLAEFVAENEALLALKRLSKLVVDPAEFDRLPPLVRQQFIPLRGPRYGVLNETYVHRDVALGIAAWKNTTGFLRNMLEEFTVEALSQQSIVAAGLMRVGKWAGAAMRPLRSLALTSWVVASPAAWLNNVAFNMFTGLLGLRFSPLRSIRAMIRGRKLLAGRDPIVERMARAGLDVEDGIFVEDIFRRSDRWIGKLTEAFGGEIERLVGRAKQIETALPKHPELADELGRIQERVSRLTGRQLHELGADLRASLSKRAGGAVRRAIDRIWDYYGKIDQVYRVGAVAELVDAGMDLPRAVEQVRRFCQNYMEVPPHVVQLANVPWGGFVPRFAYEWFRIGANLLRFRPLEVTALAAALTGWNTTLAAGEGGRWDDYFVTGGPIQGLTRFVTTLRLPSSSAAVRLDQLFALPTVFVPAGGLRGLALKFRDDPSPLSEVLYLAMSGASRFIGSALPVNLAAGWASGRDLFTDRRLIEDSAGPWQQVAARLLWTSRVFLPPVVPAISIGDIRFNSIIHETMRRQYAAREGRWLEWWERQGQLTGIQLERDPDANSNWAGLIGAAGRLVWDLDPDNPPLSGAAALARELSERALLAPADEFPARLKELEEGLRRPITRRILGREVTIQRAEEGVRAAIRAAARSGPVEFFDALPLYSQTYVLREGVRRGFHLREPQLFRTLVSAVMFGRDLLDYDPLPNSIALRQAAGTRPRLGLRHHSDPDVIRRALDYLDPGLTVLPEIDKLRAFLELQLLRAR